MAFGPSRAAARLEGSKAFTKELCEAAGIPTAAFRRFTERAAAEAHVREKGAPIVIKADGLTAGKGVTVAMTVEDALAAVGACFEGAFGGAGAEVVIEEFMEGEEVSLFALTDGAAILAMGSAQDHKRAFDGDAGPNTGGMGTYSPAPVFTDALAAQAMETIIRPTVDTLRARGTPYRGVLYAGLMLTAQGPKLVEYNCRFGDPEAQVLMPRLKDDLLLLMLSAAQGTLSTMSCRWHEHHAVCVVMAAKGYPAAPEKGSVIKGLDAAAAVEGVTIFHAGTAMRGEELVANGGRVLNAVAVGASLSGRASPRHAGEPTAPST
jgi:phosphoribosylamine---glycine ligase